MEWNQIKRFYRDHDKKIRMAAMALVVVAALLFFGLYGKKQPGNGLAASGGSSPGEASAQGADGGPAGLAANGLGSQGAGGAGGTGAQKTGTGTGELDTPATGELVVDISGQVKTPGVYRVIRGSRWADVISMAGGLTEEADIDAINQAEEVVDGQKIYIPSRGEGAAAYGSASYGNSARYGSASQSAGELININTADYETLQQIPGVGPSTAAKIIEYRQANGRFDKIEDLMQISGIGEKTFAKMKDKIRV